MRGLCEMLAFPIRLLAKRRGTAHNPDYEAVRGISVSAGATTKAAKGPNPGNLHAQLATSLSRYLEVRSLLPRDVTFKEDAITLPFLDARMRIHVVDGKPQLTIYSDRCPQPEGGEVPHVCILFTRDGRYTGFGCGMTNGVRGPACTCYPE